MINTHNLII